MVSSRPRRPSPIDSSFLRALSTKTRSPNDDRMTSILKKLICGVVVPMAGVGAYATIHFLCSSPSTTVPSTTVFEDENWVVMLMEGETGRCVVLDRHGAPIPDFLLETNSDSGAFAQKTDAVGRGRYLTFGRDATASLPTGEVRYDDMGFAVIIRKRP